MDAAQGRKAPPATKLLVRRHALVTRVTHWINVLCVSVLLMSGLQIFNAHPALYLGQEGSDTSKALFEIGAKEAADRAPSGFVRFGSHEMETTGFLGLSQISSGELSERGFPAWATLPSWRDLALGRRWHFFFAWVFAVNLLIYLAASVANGHFGRDLLLSRDELAPRTLLKDVADHLRFRLPRGKAALRYNPLQKAAYLAVAAVLLPLMLITGLAMSPGMDAILPWLIDIFGGRQSARTVHFVSASLIALFVLVHVGMVLVAGPLNELRAMITGRFMIRIEGDHE